MKTKTWLSFTAAAITAAVLTIAPRAEPVSAAGGVATGAEAPSFTLTDSHGDEHDLADYEGKIVILEWTNKDCPFVKKFYSGGHMQGLQAKYADNDEVVWLTICSSAEGKQGHLTADAWNAHIEATGIKSDAVLLDADGTVGRDYAAKTTPHIFVIDSEGVVRYQGAIDSKRSTKAADIEDATNYLTAAVDSLLAGEPVETGTTTPYGCGVKY